MRFGQHKLLGHSINLLIGGDIVVPVIGPIQFSWLGKYLMELLDFWLNKIIYFLNVTDYMLKYLMKRNFRALPYLILHWF